MIGGIRINSLYVLCISLTNHNYTNYKIMYLIDDYGLELQKWNNHTSLGEDSTLESSVLILLKGLPKNSS